MTDEKDKLRGYIFKLQGEKRDLMREMEVYRHNQDERDKTITQCKRLIWSFLALAVVEGMALAWLLIGK